MVLGCIPFTFNLLLAVLKRLRKRDGAVEDVCMAGDYHELALWRSDLRANARSQTKPFSRNLLRSRAGIPSSVSLSLYISLVMKQ